MKLWEKDIRTDKRIEKFTVGKDRELDLMLARYDILGSIAHILMLESAGLLKHQERQDLHRELVRIYDTVLQGSFVIEDGVEDIHSQVELMLTRNLGDTGKKIHSARSRNDQVLLDIKLFVREELHQVVTCMQELFQQLLSQGERYKHLLLPGYTHLQVAMPSSFGLWYSAYAECLADDLLMMLAAYRMADQNPLGSAAGYGTSFPINRQLTTDLLGFETMHFNVVNAQMSRGKTERTASFALAAVAGTLSKLAGDICLYASQNFGFITLPEELTTGSSIMPHKKNPDVFELIRARCNKIQALPGEIDHIGINLNSGYFRDMQIIKESFLPVFDELKDCLGMMIYAVPKIRPAEEILHDEKYRYIFSVEEVNKLVLGGIPFREAYQQVARQISEGTYHAGNTVIHSHEGSIGNLCNDRIAVKMESLVRMFRFGEKDRACQDLLSVT